VVLKRFAILFLLLLPNVLIGQTSHGRISSDRITNKTTITITGATPDVSVGNVFQTANSGTTVITNFLNGVDTQLITIVCGDANTSILSNVNILVPSGGFSCTVKTTISFIYIAPALQWIQTANAAGGSFAFPVEPPFTVLAGPGANSITGINDGVALASSSGISTSQSITLTPGSTHDWMFLALSNDININPGGVTTVSGGGTWTNIFSTSNNGGLWSQTLSSSNPITTQGNTINPTNWAGMLFSLALKPATTPTIVQQPSVTSGGLPNGTTTSFTGNTTNGDAILVILIGGVVSSVNTDYITDSEGNLYTPLGFATNTAGFGEVALVFLSANIAGGTHDVVKFHTQGSGVSGSFQALEVNNLVLANGLPTFRAVQPGDLPAGFVKFIAGGGLALTTALIASGACGATVTAVATGVQTTDTIEMAFQNAVTAADAGLLILHKWPTNGAVNFAYCNPTAGSITPNPISISWSVHR
jgi:hypothetical protein